MTANTKTTDTGKPTSKMDDHFSSIISSTKNEFMSLIDPATAGNSPLVDTGSYLLNAQVSGSIYGGLPGNQITVLAGEKATGKTFILLKAIRMFLKDPNARAIIWETEYATHEQDLIARGIDTDRCKMLRCNTVEALHSEMDLIIKGYLKLPKKDRYPLMFGVDSLGMLSTNKEMTDLEKGVSTTDMGTKSKLVKKIFRTLSIPLGVAGIPLIATNHIYVDPNSNSNPKYQKKKMTGGEGTYYAATTVLFFSKSADVQNDERVGIIITSKAEKGRKAVEGTVTELKLSFKTGLNRYYGLLDIAAEAGVITRIDNRFKIGDHGLMYQAQILKNPSKYFTKDILDKIDAVCIAKFSYGNVDESLPTQVEEDAKEE